MNDKDTSHSRAVASNIQEMDVVLSECHDGVIVGGEAEVLDEIPREWFLLGRFQGGHVEIIQGSLREGI